tara:strand:+ start:1729 stop:2400 length:672 start_codon:yes stop_codon:yes gene_type:complete
MDFAQQYLIWKEQLDKLVQSKSHLVETDQNNILSNFFSQAIESEFPRESDSFKTSIKDLMLFASVVAPDLEGSYRERAARVLSSNNLEPLLSQINLNDIRNMVLFEIYKRCGVAPDTYFERYSSPPGTEEQNQLYLSIAHGNAKCTAVCTENLRFVITSLVLLKRFFLVHDAFEGKQTNLNCTNLNWFGTNWVGHIVNKNLADLIWNIFLDLWTYEKFYKTHI